MLLVPHLSIIFQQQFQKKSSPSPLAAASNIISHRRRWSRWLCDTKIEPPFASLPRRGRSHPWCLRIEAAKPGACFMGLSHMTYRKTIWKAPEKPVNWRWVYTFFIWFYMSKNNVSGEEAATHRKLKAGRRYSPKLINAPEYFWSMRMYTSYLCVCVQYCMQYHTIIGM